MSPEPDPGPAPAPGWYPDPAGRADQLRYWDGRSWSSATRPVARRTPRGWIVGGAAVGLVVLTAAVVVVVSALGPSTPSVSSSSPPTRVAGSAPGRSPAGLSCVERTADFRPATTTSGRVRSGALSFPQLTAPFAAPTRTTLLRFDYLRDVASQFATLKYQGSSTGGAEVMIARLPFADGFTEVDDVAKLLYGCVQDRFPGSEEKVRQNGRGTADGHAAWIVRAHLGYGAPVSAGVKNEEITLVVLRVNDSENGLFYADVPDTHPELQPPVQAALAGLTVN